MFGLLKTFTDELKQKHLMKLTLKTEAETSVYISLQICIITDLHHYRAASLQNCIITELHHYIYYRAASLQICIIIFITDLHHYIYYRSASLQNCIIIYELETETGTES